jgi:hypothetical protein
MGMKARVIAGIIALLLIIEGLIVVLLFDRSTPSGNAVPTNVGLENAHQKANPISLENAHTGTDGWQIPPGKEATIQIQAYANATSVLPGKKLTFYVSTQQEATPYSVEIFRLGWYSGAGGRLMAVQSNLVGHMQGYYDENTYKLVGCNSCLIDTKTHLIEANWRPSYTITVPSNWTTGVYLAKFIDSNGMQTYVPFDVLGNPFSTYLAVTPDTTYAAYDDWGGYSLYVGNSPNSNGQEGSNEEQAATQAAVKVSFDRPYTGGQGASQVLRYEADAIHWMERQGYDLSYISNVDLHENPDQLLQHKAYLSLGHDEYWTKEMRDGVENARNKGISLAFLGANASYWQMRFEPDSKGNPDRTIVCYKVQTRLHDLARDPLYGKDNTRVTAQWRDPVLGRPENALIGVMYSGLTHSQQGFPWVVNSHAAASFLDGTGLRPGQQYGCGLVGYEWDRIYKNGATPAGLQILGTSPTIDENGQADTSDTTYYRASSGVLVFATGSIYWTSALDSYEYQTDPLCAHQNPEIPGMQKLMLRVMDALVNPQHMQQRLASSTTSTGIPQL